MVLAGGSTGIENPRFITDHVHSTRVGGRIILPAAPSTSPAFLILLGEGLSFLVFPLVSPGWGGVGVKWVTYQPCQGEVRVDHLSTWTEEQKIGYQSTWPGMGHPPT